MNRLAIAVLALILALSQISSAEVWDRALWVWDKIPRDRWGDFFDFCFRHNISLLLYHASKADVEGDAGYYRDLVSTAHSRGLKVYASGGNAIWSLNRYHASAFEHIERILDYNSRSRNEERFDGVCQDVEPNALPEFQERWREILPQYLEMIGECAKRVEASQTDLEYWVAIPFWYEESSPSYSLEWKGREGAVSFHALDIADGVVVMAYRNRTGGDDGIVRHVRDEIEYAGGIGKRVYVGLETQMSEERQITFYGMGMRALEDAMELVGRVFSESPGFAGFAIHTYESFREMAGE
ncbi:MAG: hypothetical protein ACUVXI_08135 [bacterium]